VNEERGVGSSFRFPSALKQTNYRATESIIESKGFIKSYWSNHPEWSQCENDSWLYCA